ncbi:MAG: HD domain-containing protein [Clostridia bacterium]|nr:HD domain-containing protein [Clostridia bacterium]
MLPRLLKEERENQSLFRYAARSGASLGRMTPETPCEVRTDFERDTGRILYSLDFRRLRHKTQVFFNPQNDHICTRMEHVLYVKYISCTIANALGLNSDLVEAIALAHDLGHAPFGHSGERRLAKLIAGHDPGETFRHEQHSLRVIDRLAARPGHEGPGGINLTYEVRDGVVNHCGERYDEWTLVPRHDTLPEDLYRPGESGGRMPSTLEGCVVRMADKIAYVGRDIEDAARAGIMEMEDIPIEIRSTLGENNSGIINTLVRDIIDHSLGRDCIAMSEEVGQAMEALLRQNERQIYHSDKIKRYEEMADLTLDGVFEGLYAAMSDPERLAASRDETLRAFQGFLTARGYGPESTAARRVTDYVAGMSDNFATRCYERLYWV